LHLDNSKTKLSSNYLFPTKIKLELNIVPHVIAVIGVEEEHPQAACLNFDGPPHQFDLNFAPSDLQQQMHGKLTTSYPFPF